MKKNVNRVEDLMTFCLALTLNKTQTNETTLMIFYEKSVTKRRNTAGRLQSVR